MKIRSLALTVLFTACLLQSAMAQQMNNSIAQKTINISPAKNTTNQVKKDFFAEPAPDKTAPTVQITAPQTNQIVKRAVEIKANATDNVGVDRVEFYVDGNTVGVSKNAPYAANWDSTKSHDDSLR